MEQPRPQLVRDQDDVHSAGQRMDKWRSRACGAAAVSGDSEAGGRFWNKYPMKGDHN